MQNKQLQLLYTKKRQMSTPDFEKRGEDFEKPQKAPDQSRGRSGLLGYVVGVEGYGDLF